MITDEKIDDMNDREWQFVTQASSGNDFLLIDEEEMKEVLDGLSELKRLRSLRARLAEIQRAMHSAGHKSAAAMLNPLLRGDDE